MKKKLALLAGGYTSEYEISLKTAETIYNNLDTDKFDVYLIIISRDGWYYTDQAGTKIEMDRHDFTIPAKEGRIQFDVVFNGVIGSPGEDGKLQGYLDIIDIPYTSCDTLTSAITMNKGYTKALVGEIQELFVARSQQLFSAGDGQKDSISNTLKLPLFVKPNNGGSSIGMSKVETANALGAALEKAFGEGDQVLVEEFIEGREFSVGAYRADNEIVVLPATEVITTREFFDFQAKYTAGGAETFTPGRMTKEETDRVVRIIKAIYKQLNCKGVVRVDYFLQKDTSDFYFVEINTVPGQTEHSFIPKQVRAAGMSMKDFYNEIIHTAIIAHRKSDKIDNVATFKS